MTTKHGKYTHIHGQFTAVYELVKQPKLNTISLSKNGLLLFCEVYHIIENKLCCQIIGIDNH